MISAKEFLLFSLLSYYDFQEKHCHKRLLELWKAGKEKEFAHSTFISLQRQFSSQFCDFFEEELSTWSIHSLENRTAKNKKASQSGFYAICFERMEKKQGEENYVLAFRGSESTSLEDAYLDFVNTDFVMGMGKVPSQFHEGVEIYEKTIATFSLAREDLALTGHSLGGGIAQYVALSIDRLHRYIPSTCTWNAVGVNKKGIVHIGEFLNLQEVLENIPELQEREKYCLRNFDAEYQAFFQQEYDKMKEKKQDDFQLDANFFKRLYSQTKIQQYLSFLSEERREKLLSQEHLLEKLFDIEQFYSKIRDGEVFMQNIRENKKYQEKIINYGHSKDLTHSLFAHVGRQCLVDKAAQRRSYSKTSLFSKMNLLKKSFSSHHYENVFIPYLSGKELGKDFSMDYLAALVRKITLNENAFSSDFLADFYSLENLETKLLEKYRQEILHYFLSHKSRLYYKQVAQHLEKLSHKDFSQLWLKTQQRLSSPYRYRDLLDVLIYEY